MENFLITFFLRFFSWFPKLFFSFYNNSLVKQCWSFQALPIVWHFQKQDL